MECSTSSPIRSLLHSSKSHKGAASSRADACLAARPGRTTSDEKFAPLSCPTLAGSSCLFSSSRRMDQQRTGAQTYGASHRGRTRLAWPPLASARCCTTPHSSSASTYPSAGSIANVRAHIMARTKLAAIPSISGSSLPSRLHLAPPVPTSGLLAAIISSVCQLSLETLLFVCRFVCLFILPVIA